jgi:hypothetical protein
MTVHPFDQILVPLKQNGGIQSARSCHCSHQVVAAHSFGCTALMIDGIGDAKMARQKQVGADCVTVIGMVTQSEDVTNS